MAHTGLADIYTYGSVRLECPPHGAHSGDDNIPTYHMYTYTYTYMGQIPGPAGYPPPGEGYPWEGRPLLKFLISARNHRHGAPTERLSSGGALEEGLLIESICLLEESVCHLWSYMKNHEKC